MDFIRSLLLFFLVLGFAVIVAENANDSPEFVGHVSGSRHYHDDIRRLQAFKSSLTLPEFASSNAPAPSPVSQREYLVTSYGADPTGKSDCTEALLRAMRDAFNGPGEGVLMEGITNLGGAQIKLQGGTYLISQPLRFPAAGVGNLIITGGTIRASENFPMDGYLIDLSASSSSLSYDYEFITLKDLMLDCSYRGGGISVVKSLRTNIDNVYVAHFNTDGILVRGGHETYIRNSFLGQHITAGGDPGERNFSGTGISLQGNDNALTDVVIFSASVGVMVSGQANTLSGIHCYNKATGFGGTGIHLKLPGLTQTRILNCYMDFTAIVAEDPVQLTVSNSFFLGDAAVSLKSINGVANGVTIVDNMFSGSDKGVDIVQLDESNGPFTQISQVVVDRNNVRGMNSRATVAKGSVERNGTSWTVDFSRILLFPDLINHVQYSLSSSSDLFPNHALRNVSRNRVVIESDVAVPAVVFVAVDQAV